MPFSQIKWFNKTVQQINLAENGKRMAGLVNTANRKVGTMTRLLTMKLQLSYKEK